MKKFIPIIFVLTLIMFAPALSAQEVSFAVSPARQHIMIKPGYILKQNITFTNLGDPTTASLIIQPLKINHTSGNFELSEVSDPSISFFSATPINSPFSLKNKQEKNVELTVTVNPDAEEKDYYYGVMIQSVPSPATEGTASIKVKNSVGSVIVFTVSKTGETASEITIPLFSAVGGKNFHLFGRDRHLFDTFDKIPLNLTIANTGKNFTKIQGKIEVTSNAGYVQEIPIIDKLIYADSQTSVGFPPIKRKMQYFGHFTAKVVLVDVSNKLSTQTATEFYVYPIKLLSLIALIILLICVGYLYILKRHKTKKSR